MGESTLALQIQNLVGGGTIDQEFCDDAATDACKEIINQLPSELKEKCVVYTEVADANGTDLDSKGEIMYVTRDSANSGGYYLACRKIEAMYAGRVSDDTDLNYYGTPTDPVYWISSNTTSSLLYIYPDPTGDQKGRIYHIAYPTVNVDASSTVEIANFPDEATYLVVLYTATRQLLKYQADMTVTWNSDITTALTAINAALDKIDTYSFDDEDTFTTANSQLTRVKEALDGASSLIAGDTPSANYDVHANLADVDAEITNEDVELASARMQQTQTTLSVAAQYLQRAQIHLTEWTSISGVAIQEASGFIQEANARLQQDVTKYQWYSDQYAKLSAEYQRGLAALKGA